MVSKLAMKNIEMAGKNNNKDKKFMAIEDSGANVNIGTMVLANYATSMGYTVTPALQNSQINTAGDGEKMRILGWLESYSSLN